MSYGFHGPVLVDRGEGQERLGRRPLSGRLVGVLARGGTSPPALGFLWPERHWYAFDSWEFDPWTGEYRRVHVWGPGGAAVRMTKREADDYFIHLQETYWKGQTRRWRYDPSGGWVREA